jgi:hypothetical protein
MSQSRVALPGLIVATAALVFLIVTNVAPVWVVALAFALYVPVWAYHCVVQAGYPVLATAAWAVPVGLLIAGGLVLDYPWALLAPALGFGLWLGLYFNEAARNLWYVSLFRWRPSPATDSVT